MTPEQARQELARREIARRQAENQQSNNPPQPQAGSVVQDRNRPLTPKEYAHFGVPEGTTRQQVRDMLQKRMNASEAQSAKAQKKIDNYKRVLRPLNATMRFADAATLGAPTRIQSGILEGKDLITGEDRDRYAEVKGVKDDLKKMFPKTSAVSDVGGAIFGLGKVMKAGGTATRFVPQGLKGAKGLGATTAAVAADGAAIMGTEALIAGRDPLKAAKQGAGVGAALNVATRGIGSALSPVAQNIKARFNPDLMAKNQLIAALKRSGQTVDDIKAKFSSAKKDGADEFMIADALKEEGQRLASGVARQPGEGGQALVDALNARQAGQSGRVVNALDEGFQTGGKTAAEATEAMSQNIRKTDRANFGKVPDEPVAPTSAMKFIQENTQAVQKGVKPTKAERALAKYGEMISSASGSNNTQRMIAIRQDLADAADKAFRGGQGGLGTKLKNLKKAVDDDILQTSSAYREANAASSKLRGIRDQVKAGQTGATRGRQEDLVSALQKASPEERAAFGVGFADTNIARAQKGAEGVNAARPFTSQRFNALAKELTEDGGETIGRKLQRENDMFATRHRALGGSRTADNLADQANVNAAVGLGSKIVRGDVVGAAGDVVRGVANRITGQNQKSRDALAKMLTQNSDDVLVKEAARRLKHGEKLSEAQRKAIAPMLALGATSGNQ